jgi:hypothetical protein
MRRERTGSGSPAAGRGLFVRDYTVSDETTHLIHPRQNGKTTFLAEAGKAWSDPTSDPIADMRAWAEHVLNDTPPPGSGIVSFIAQHLHGGAPAYQLVRIHSAGLRGTAVYDWTRAAWHTPAYCFTCMTWVKPFTNPVRFV